MMARCCHARWGGHRVMEGKESFDRMLKSLMAVMMASQVRRVRMRKPNIRKYVNMHFTFAIVNDCETETKSTSLRVCSG